MKTKYVCHVLISAGGEKEKEPKKQVLADSNRVLSYQAKSLPLSQVYRRS